MIPSDFVESVYKPMGDWVQRANCMGVDPSLFFPGKGQNGTSDEAKAVCAACVCRQECLDYALTTPVEKWGIFGGMNYRERQAVSAGRGSA